MAVASHSRRVDVGRVAEAPLEEHDRRPTGRRVPRRPAWPGYVLGITVTLDSPDLAASRSLGTTTRSTCAATDRWNRRQSLPLSRAWYQAKRARTELSVLAPIAAGPPAVRPGAVP